MIITRAIPKGMAAFKHRNYRLYWIGQLVSVMGTWMQRTAQGWLVLELTNSAFLLGLLNAVQFTPLLLFSLTAGVVADRWPKRKLLIITQSVMMALALILGYLTMTGKVQYWHVVVLAGIFGTFNSFDAPARQSFIIEMVGPEDLMNAIALNSTVFNGARIVGPALAGLTIAYLGMEACFFINGFSFLAYILSLLLIKVSEKRESLEDEVKMVKKIKEGLLYIKETPVIFSTVLLLAVMSIFALNFQVLAPVLAKEALGLEAEGYGFLLSAEGVGALLGAIFLAGVSFKGPKAKLLLGAAVSLCVTQIILSGINSFLLAMVVLVFAGSSLIIFTASVNTTLQLNTPDRLRGRVMSAYTLVFGGFLPLGSLFSGAIAQMWGAQVSLGLGSLIALGGLVSIIFWRNKHQKEAGSHDRN